jgi:Ca2+-binding RTX toxin-like protein
MSGEDGDDVMLGGDGNDYMIGGSGADEIHGGAGDDIIIGELGADKLWGDAGADRFVFKGAGALDGGDTIMDFQDGLDRISIEKLGVTKYADGGAPGTAFAHDLADGDVSIHVVFSAGAKFDITIADPGHTLTAANFSAADFLFG